MANTEQSVAAEGQNPVNLFTPETLSCPHAAWAQLRREDPIARVHPPGMIADTFVITRKEDIDFIARRPEIFSSVPDPAVWRWGKLEGDFEPIFAEGYNVVQTIVTSDPPNAAKYRRIVNEALSASRVRQLHGKVQAIIDTLLDRVPVGEPVDFRDAFAVPLPLQVITVLLDLPTSDAKFIYDFTNDYMALIDPATPLDNALEHARAVVVMQNYLASYIKAHREAPAENLLSIIANARNDDGTFITIEECLSIALITAVGGNETTRNALATAAYRLADEPELWRALKQTPEKAAAFAEEAVRTGGPATTTPRRVLQDTYVNGTFLPKGATLFVMWASGSRDEAAYEHPAQIRLDRKNARDHTSFGVGIHHCAGAALARLEITLAVESWLKRYKTIQFAVDKSEIHYEPVFAIQALHSLPLVLTAED